MTKEQLAEKLFPVLDEYTVEQNAGNVNRRYGFLKGLELLPELAEWIHKAKNITIEKSGYVVSPGVPISYKELAQYFLTVKYSTHEQQ